MVDEIIRDLEEFKTGLPVEISSVHQARLKNILRKLYKVSIEYEKMIATTEKEQLASLNPISEFNESTSDYLGRPILFLDFDGVLNTLTPE